MKIFSCLRFPWDAINKSNFASFSTNTEFTFSFDSLLLELSEFSFFPSASESLGRRNSEDEDEEEEDIGRTCTQQETPLDTPCLLKDSYRGASFSAKEKGKHLVLENESQTSEDSFKIRFFRSGNAVAILTHLKNCQKLA